MDNTTALEASELALHRSAHLLQRAQTTLELLMAGGDAPSLPITQAISGKDVIGAVELAIKLDDYLQRSALRKKLQASLLQAAEVLAEHYIEALASAAQVRDFRYASLDRSIPL